MVEPNRNDYMKPQRRKDIRIPIKIIDLRAFGRLCYTENHEEYFVNDKIIEAKGFTMVE
jgi:hypothetical protein